MIWVELNRTNAFSSTFVSKDAHVTLSALIHLSSVSMHIVTHKNTNVENNSNLQFVNCNRFLLSKKLYDICVCLIFCVIGAAVNVVLTIIDSHNPMHFGQSFRFDIGQFLAKNVNKTIYAAMFSRQITKRNE